MSPLGRLPVRAKAWAIQRPMSYVMLVTAERPSDAVLVTSARAGEAWASERLFRRYRKMVYGLALRLTGRSVAVDDLVQESFMLALRSLDTLNEPQSFARWLGSIVVRTANKMRRHERMRTKLGLARPDPVDADAFIAQTAPPDVATELGALYSHLDVLPVEEHRALMLRRVEGLGLEETAQRMNRSVATVKRRLAAAERHLQSVSG